MATHRARSPQRARSPSSSSSSSRSDSDGEAAPVRKEREQLIDSVDHFLGELLKAIKERKVSEMHRLYEDQYNKITAEHFSSRRWPSSAVVADQVSSEPLFLILYNELYYRHVYAKLQPTFKDRRGAWENYCKLLDLLVSQLEDGESCLALPAQWLWDILDEFVYHYQTYCAMRSKAMRIHKENEIAHYRDNPEVNNTIKVLVYLQQLVRNSKIEEYLTAKENGKEKEGKGPAFNDETSRSVGYFALMQLLRMHSLLGDFHLAMKTIQAIDIGAEVPLFYAIPSCHVTLYYYMGFAYFMMRRYADATNTFSEILVFLSKKTKVNTTSYQFDATMKKQDQMYALLLLSTTLSPRPIDETLEKNIREKHGEKQTRLRNGEELCFNELFAYACPKFVHAAAPDFENLKVLQEDTTDPLGREAVNRQSTLFIKEMRQQQQLPRIGSYMKLYTAIEVQKLAQLCEMDTEALRDQLMCVMHKTCQKVHTKGPPLEGTEQHSAEVQFYLDGGMVHINAHREEREHADVFLESISKLQDLMKKMATSAAQPASKAA